MKFEQPQTRQGEKRTLGDAELIKKGAEYDIAGRLEVTEKQLKSAGREMKKEKDIRNKAELIKELKAGDEKMRELIDEAWVLSHELDEPIKNMDQSRMKDIQTSLSLALRELEFKRRENIGTVSDILREAI